MNVVHQTDGLTEYTKRETFFNIKERGESSMQNGGGSKRNNSTVYAAYGNVANLIKFRHPTREITSERQIQLLKQ